MNAAEKSVLFLEKEGMNRSSREPYKRSDYAVCRSCVKHRKKHSMRI